MDEFASPVCVYVENLTGPEPQAPFYSFEQPGHPMPAKMAGRNYLESLGGCVRITVPEGTRWAAVDPSNPVPPGRLLLLPGVGSLGVTASTLVAFALLRLHGCEIA